MPVFRPTPRANTLSPLSTSGPSFNGIATSPIETPHADNSLHIQLPHPTTDSLEVPLNPTPDISSSSSIPPSPADTQDRKSTRLNSSHSGESRMPSSA